MTFLKHLILQNIQKEYQELEHLQKTVHQMLL